MSFLSSDHPGDRTTQAYLLGERGEERSRAMRAMSSVRPWGLPVLMDRRSVDPARFFWKRTSKSSKRHQSPPVVQLPPQARTHSLPGSSRRTQTSRSKKAANSPRTLRAADKHLLSQGKKTYGSPEIRTQDQSVKSQLDITEIPCSARAQQ